MYSLVTLVNFQQIKKKKKKIVEKANPNAWLPYLNVHGPWGFEHFSACKGISSYNQLIMPQGRPPLVDVTNSDNND